MNLFDWLNSVSADISWSLGCTHGTKRKSFYFQITNLYHVPHLGISAAITTTGSGILECLKYTCRYLSCQNFYVMRINPNNEPYFSLIETPQLTISIQDMFDKETIALVKFNNGRIKVQNESV